MILGIDEAGRGSVLGSMFIAGFAIEKPKLEILEKIGVRDSKSFNTDREREKRDKLAKKLEVIGKVIIHEVRAPEIDQAVLDKKDNLNLLEIRNFASIIVETCVSTGVEAIYLDAISRPEYSKQKMSNLLGKLLGSAKFQVIYEKDEITAFFIDGARVEIIAENKADYTYPVVAAASIMAKTARENSLRQLEDQYGFKKGSLGSGYPNENDLKLMAFLDDHAMEIKSRKYPFVRYSWKWKNANWKRIVNDQNRSGDKQQALAEFFK